MSRKILPILLSAVMIFETITPVYAADAVINEEKNTAYVVCPPSGGLVAQSLDEDELLEGYLLTAAGASDDEDEQASEKEYELNDYEQAAFEALHEPIQKIASGETASTIVEIPAECYSGISSIKWTYEELGLDSTYADITENTEEGEQKKMEIAEAITKKMDPEFSYTKVAQCLFAAMPYEFYWCECHGIGVAYGWEYTETEITLQQMGIIFLVSDNYRSDSEAGQEGFELDASKASRASAAAAVAQTIVDKAADLSDYEKLVYYKNQICNLVTYDNAAEESLGVDSDGTYDGDPWQLVSVFDNDPETNVVCEGYAKALQFLCQKSTFASPYIRCMQVSGTMKTSSGGGGHMWNLVIMDDNKSYLVDLTNSDTGNIGEYGGLFLAGASGDVKSGYTVTIPGQEAALYTYDEDTLSIYSTAKLTLASVSYGEDEETTDDCAHTYQHLANVVNADCTHAGYSGDLICDDCDKIVKRGSVIEATGHSYADEYTVDEEPTCTKSGSKSRHCANCDAVTDVTVIEATGHTPKDPVKENIEKSTCTKKGSYDEVVYCSVCGEEISRESKKMPLASHSYASEYTVDQTPTCTKAGSKSRHCINCDAVTDVTVIKATGHTAEDAVVENKTEPTCAKEGSYDEVVYCSVCGGEISREKKTIAATEHSYASEYTVDQKPTCTKAGSKSRHCKNCDAVTDVTAIEATGHSYETVTTPATLSANGSVITKCKNCGDIISRATISFPKTMALSTSSYTYSGKTVTPSVSVSAADGKIIAPSNYTVSYAGGRRNVGKYTVTVTFKGNYTGSLTKTFVINPKGTKIRSLTAAKNKFTVRWNKQVAQTSGYQIRYAKNSRFTGAKTITIAKNSLTSRAVSRLSAKKTYYVRIRTYKSVGKVKYYSGWSAVKKVKTK